MNPAELKNPQTVDAKVWAEQYRNARIVNIRRGRGSRSCYIYAEIQKENGEVLVSALLDYCTDRMIEVADILGLTHP